MAYATLAQVKGSLGITDTASDTLITAALSAAEDMIDGYAGRTFGTAGTAATARVYATTVPDLVFIDDAVEITLVETDPTLDNVWSTSWATTDWQAEPLNGLVGGRARPYTSLRAVGDYAFPKTNQAAVRVTARWGWDAVPSQITQATVLQTARLFKRADAPLGVAGFGDMGAIRVSRYLDPDVELLVSPFRIGTNAIGGIA